jgi:RNA polymerase primary sigma factor
VARKRIRASRPDTESRKVQANGQSSSNAKVEDVEQQIKAITEKGRRKGYLTYEEMNEDLSDDIVSPARLDSLLATLDEMGIHLLDEADVEKHEAEEFGAAGSEEGSSKAEQLKEDELLEKQLVGEQEVARRIDDPIRTYLTQMGEIDLLTRDQEISLARKIEMARMGFRRKMLESDYCARNAVDILQQVHEGMLSFDRTMKISTAENLVRSVIKKRMPGNIQTVNTLLKKNQTLFKKLLQSSSGDDGKNAEKLTLKRIHRNKRKIATLLEELSLRTSRIQPMKNKLHGICQKMHQLEQTIAAGPNRDITEEDIDAMEQELDGLQDLVMEMPKQLDKRLRSIERVFDQYEHAIETAA